MTIATATVTNPGEGVSRTLSTSAEGGGGGEGRRGGGPARGIGPVTNEAARAILVF